MVLFGCTAMMAMAYYLFQMNTDNEKNTIATQRVYSYKALQKAVQNYLDDPQLCTAALNNLQVNSAFTTPLNVQFTMPYIGGNAELKAGWRSPNGTKLKNITLTMDGIVRNKVRRDGNFPHLMAASGTLTLWPDHAGVNMKRADHEVYKIKLMFYLWPSGSNLEVRGCFGANTPAAFCTSAGGTYNLFTGTLLDRMCEPDLYCFASKMGITNQAALCLPPYQAVPVAPGLFVCQWCNSSPTP